MSRFGVKPSFNALCGLVPFELYRGRRKGQPCRPPPVRHNAPGDEPGAFAVPLVLRKQRGEGVRHLGLFEGTGIGMG